MVLLCLFDVVIFNVAWISCYIFFNKGKAQKGLAAFIPDGGGTSYRGTQRKRKIQSSPHKLRNGPYKDYKKSNRAQPLHHRNSISNSGHPQQLRGRKNAGWKSSKGLLHGG
jgi:hypothetical protein